jgi:RimJ/RimL family protein N-acetyltransferase
VSHIIDTERLSLRELEPGDLAFVADMLANPEVSFYYERTFTRRDSEVWLERQLARYQRDGHGLWLASERRTNTPVGQVGLALQDVEGAKLPELGWLLARPFWGLGYATEAGRAARRLAGTRWRYPSVISLIRPENTPSRRVADRVGLVAGREVDFHDFRHIVYEGTTTFDDSASA